MKILLTNDDSHRSPLLAFIIKYLKSIGELTIVVPKHEQSWKGKSMTRFGHLHLEEMELFGEKAYTVDGTPADCVNVAIYHLYKDKKPDLVVSGINAGLNAGLGFIWSSGTVGACLEGNIAGIPGIALSQHFDSETREHYIASYAIPEATYKRLGEQTSVMLDKTFKVILESKNALLNKAITWNINFPFHTHKDMQYLISSAGQSFYGSCFAKREILNAGEGSPIARFEHELKDIYPDHTDNSDGHRLSAGHVTITPLDIRTFAQNQTAEALRLQELFEF